MHLGWKQMRAAVRMKREQPMQRRATEENKSGNDQRCSATYVRKSAIDMVVWTSAWPFRLFFKLSHRRSPKVRTSETDFKLALSLVL